MATTDAGTNLSDLADTIIISLLLTMLVFNWLGIYRSKRIQPLPIEVFNIIRAVLVVWILEITIDHFLHDAPVSRIMRGMYLITWPTMLIITHAATRIILRYLRSTGYNLRSATIVGTGRLSQKLLHAFKKGRWTGYHVEYLIDDNRKGTKFMSLDVKGPLCEIEKILQEKPVDAVFVALPKHQHHLLENILNNLSELIVDINVLPDLIEFNFLSHQVSQIESLPIVHLTRSPQSGISAIAKRVIDITGAAIGIILLSPLMILIAITIKFTSPGRVFYHQKRTSVGGNEFDLLKFRSMTTAGDLEDDLQWGSDCNDSRVTPVGRILRKLSLDELPQLINVLTGKMSLVGPRPEKPEFIERFRKQFPRYMLRHHVKAGMTGWAQVNGFRGRTSLRKRVQYDLDYITRWNILFDLRILLLTCVRGFVNDGD